MTKTKAKELIAGYRNVFFKTTEANELRTLKILVQKAITDCPFDLDVHEDVNGILDIWLKDIEIYINSIEQNTITNDMRVATELSFTGLSTLVDLSIAPKN